MKLLYTTDQMEQDVTYFHFRDHATTYNVDLIQFSWNTVINHANCWFFYQQLTLYEFELSQKTSGLVRNISNFVDSYETDAN